MHAGGLSSCSISFTMNRCDLTIYLLEAIKHYHVSIWAGLVLSEPNHLPAVSSTQMLSLYDVQCLLVGCDNGHWDKQPLAVLFLSEPFGTQ